MPRWTTRILLCAALLYPNVSAAEQWLALTLAPDGAWGAGASDHSHVAMTAAIAQCNGRSSRARGSITGCGALLRTARNGWGIAEICGQHWHVSVERTLAEAEFELRAWKLSLRYEYGYALPECRRLATVGPDGNLYAFTQY